MLFTLEAIYAKEGDSLLLHYGPKDDPSCILIDGGPSGVYKKYLKPRIEEIRENRDIGEDEAFPLEMMMVSHIDADHISGIIDLVQEMEEAGNQHQPVAFQIDTLWHNGFDDIIGNEANSTAVASEAGAAAASQMDGQGVQLPNLDRETLAVVASTRQGRDLQRIAKKLKLDKNQNFEGLVRSQKEPISLSNGLEFVVIGPLEKQIEEFQKSWDKDLKKILDKEKEAAEAQAFEDSSAFNLASISVLARLGDKSVLLTGDARGDFLVKGLVETGILDGEDDELKVDILKMPHHGSVRNIAPSFFKQIVADHYVISANGKHDNPDIETLQLLADSRGDDEYTIHLTFGEKAYESTNSEKMKKALKDVHEWLTTKKPDNCKIVYRDVANGDLSVKINLADSLPF